VAINIAQAEAAKAREEPRRLRPHQSPAIRYVHRVFGDPATYTVRDDEDDEYEDPTYEEDEPVEVIPRRIPLRRQ